MSPNAPSPQLPDLVLHLKKEYFEQIKSGVKKEEYREMTPYWFSRLFGKKYRNIILVSGYPKGLAGAIIRPYRGYELKTIEHELFGPLPVLVYAIQIPARGA